MLTKFQINDIGSYVQIALQNVCLKKSVHASFNAERDGSVSQKNGEVQLESKERTQQLRGPLPSSTNMSTISNNR